MSYTNPNLLPTDGSTFETGTTSWTADAVSSVEISTTHLEGNYSTKLTATVAATWHSGYSPKVPVTPGTVYAGHVYVGRFPALPGTTSRAVFEWFDNSGAFISASTGWEIPAGNEDGFWTAESPTAIGTAPPSAVTTRIRVDINGLEVDEYVYFDNVYLCEAPRIEGNRLSFNAQSFEGSLSDWTISGATGTRYPGNFITGAGLFLLSVDGACTVSLNDAVPVDEGTEYVAYSIVSLDSAGDVSTTIEWYDSSDALLSSSESTQSIAVGGWYACGVGTAPSGAVGARLVLDIPGAAKLDQIQLKVAPNVPGNLLTFNEYSFEASVPPMDNENFGTPSLSAEISSEGHRSVQATRTSAGPAMFGLARDIPITAGETYKLRTVLYADGREASATGTFKSALDIVWLNGSGNVVRDDEGPWFDTPVAAGSVPAVSKRITATAPPGAVYANIRVLLDTTNSTTDIYGVDELTFVKSEPLYTIDVDSDLGVIKSTLLLGIDHDTYPNIDTLSVWRVEPDGTQVPVRGFGSELVDFPYPGVPFVFEDYEAPLGEEVWYRVVYSASNGEDPDTVLSTAKISAPVLDNDHMWFKAPGLPALNRKIVPESPIAWARQARSTTYDIVGRVNPIQVTSTRAGRTGALVALVWEVEDSETLNKMLDYGTPVLLQAMPGNGLNGNTYVHVGDVSEDPVSWNASVPFRRWGFALTQIDRPSGGMQGSALRTWDDAIGALETWSAFYDAYENWAEVLTG